MKASVARTDELLYFRLFDEAERVRWQMADIPWDAINHEAVDHDLVAVANLALQGELGAFDGTRQYMDLFSNDDDFSQWLAVWFYEETKHPDVLLRWLERVGATIPSGAIAGGHAAPSFVSSRPATLANNFIAELVASESYLALARYSAEPVLAEIATRLAGDEARHGSHFYSYLQRELARSPRRVADERKVLVVLDLWLRGASAVAHPVKTAVDTGRGKVASNAAHSALPIGGRALERRLCRMFGHLVGQPDLANREALGGAIRRDAARVTAAGAAP